MDQEIEQGKRLSDLYEELKPIGKGSYGTAFLCRRKSDGQVLVTKRIRLDNLSKEEKDGALNEVALLSQFDHINIIRYHDFVFEVKILNALSSLINYNSKHHHPKWFPLSH